MTFILRILVLTCVLIFSPSIQAQDINDWFQEQLIASSELRHVDFDYNYKIALFAKKKHKKKMDPLLRSLVILDCERAWGYDSLTVSVIDQILMKTPKFRLDQGLALSLFYLKYKCLFLHNKYHEIEQMTDYMEQHFAENEKLRLQAGHWRRIAQAGRGVGPVEIHRSKEVVGVGLSHDSLDHLYIEANLNQAKNRRLIVDTGLMSSSVLFKDFAEQIGVRMLPDSTHATSATHPDVRYTMQLGILDSLRINGILIKNLPVWVSDEKNEYDCDGFIGTPDLARLEYMEFTRDSLVFRYPIPEPRSKTQFTMNAGANGDRCICIPYKINGRNSSFLLDTGTNGFILPQQYVSMNNVFVEIGGMQIGVGNQMMSAHGFLPYQDSCGFIGTPLLYAFERLCLNFRECNVEFVKKEDGNFIGLY